MDVSLAITRNYNNEQRTMNNEQLCKTNPKQTQFLPAYGGFSKNPHIFSFQFCILAIRICFHRKVSCGEFLPLGILRRYSDFVFYFLFSAFSTAKNACGYRRPVL
jgi:hypothetical protein